MNKELEPLNMTILDPSEFIPRKDCKEVTSHAIFEPSSTMLKTDGFWSESIFGPRASAERLIKRGYIDLRAKVFTPHLFKQLMTLKSYYQEILAGRTYAKYDKELKDLIPVETDDEEGRTGFQFFVEMYPSLHFALSDSEKRLDKIKLLEKFDDRLFMDKMIVIPAGLRDIKEDHGRMTSEDINKLYLGLLSLAKSLPEGGTEDPIYDGIRYQMQMKIQEIYNYITNIVEGKGGYAQSKYAARAVTYGNRNVITAYPISKAISPSSPSMLKMSECACPLFQFAKGAIPLVIYWIKNAFTNMIFNDQSYSVALINPETYKLEMCEITDNERKRFITSDGISDMVNDFRNKEAQFNYVTVNVVDENKKKRPYYLYLMYDTGDEIYMFRGLEDFKTGKRKANRFNVDIIQEQLQVLETLNIHDYIVLGSSALKVYGMNLDYTETGDTYKQIGATDLDILVSDKEFAAIKSNPQFTKTENNVYRNEALKIDVYNEAIQDYFLNKSYDDIKRTDTEMVKDVVLLTPEVLLNIYETHKRLKDKYKKEFLKKITFYQEYVRPMTMCEMIYIATYLATQDKYTTSTRYPIANLEGINIWKIHLVSTTPGREITFLNIESSISRVFPEYPIIDGEVQTSLSMHPSVLESYRGESWLPL